MIFLLSKGFFKPYFEAEGNLKPRTANEADWADENY